MTTIDFIYYRTVLKKRERRTVDFTVPAVACNRTRREREKAIDIVPIW
jgi:hypothetical protein